MTRINEIDDEGFTTVKKVKTQMQTCKYCKKQGHSISNCWTLQSKNKATQNTTQKITTDKRTDGTYKSKIKNTNKSDAITK